ncbi:MAG TPA: hypothetical protein VKG22_10000 [Stellaceae bacterium]|nr:hypothetical protein [Stellaceae bacterium]
MIARFGLGSGKGGGWRGQMIREGKARIPCAGDGEAVIAEFIRTRGITRCPTACVLPTQGSVDAADRAALEEHAVAQERLRQARATARSRQFWTAAFAPPGDK